MLSLRVVPLRALRSRGKRQGKPCSPDFIAFMKSAVDFLGQIREHWGRYRSHRIKDLVIISDNREHVMYSH